VSNLEQVFDLRNLRRAYRWIMSNPDAHYKSYFRDSYDAFAIASETHLKWIRQEVLKERYEASHASKILTPKPSGTLRPITLLTVEDQIVYQACVNLIAEALKRRTIKRYEKRVFAHLYAGKSSQFFYMRWQRSYRKFATRIVSAYHDGYEYVADFDLTSFYDSIDHHVLRHFLKQSGVDEDTIDFLLQCLKVWTSTTWSTGPQNIYHEHGIPQGPLASGMLSEAVLQHIDRAGEQGRRTIYLRYVDDIKILAKREEELRRKLIKLDITAKEIGLFPQTAKINLRRIADPHEEVKSVSRPAEPSMRLPIDQKRLSRRLLELSRGGKVSAAKSTRFKYLLAHVKPTHRLNARIINILYNQPELAPSISLYITKYKIIPKKLAADIDRYLRTSELYHSVHGSLLRACLGRFPPAEAAVLGRFCAGRLVRPKRGSIQIQASYKEALIAWGLSTNSLSFAEYDRIVVRERDWWVKKCAIRELTVDLYGAATYADFVNRCLRASQPEVARIAAARLLQDDIKLTTPYGNVETTAKQILKATKIIRAVGQPKSRINQILAYIIGRGETTYDWKKFFGADHGHAERMMIF
jgi:retron-type reverse transcriptase